MEKKEIKKRNDCTEESKLEERKMLEKCKNVNSFPHKYAINIEIKRMERERKVITVQQKIK